MGAVIANFLVRTSTKTFQDDAPSPGVMTQHGAQHVMLVDSAGEELTSLGGGSGGAVTSLTLASGVTSNTTSASVSGVTGPKTFWGEVSGTGAVTATIAIYGDVDDDEAGGVLLATITLSGTTKATDATPTSTASFPYYYVTTTNVTGTGATVNVYAFY
jgi:hypothetical protein